MSWSVARMYSTSTLVVSTSTPATVAIARALSGSMGFAAVAQAFKCLHQVFAQVADMCAHGLPLFVFFDDPIHLPGNCALELGQLPYSVEWAAALLRRAFSARLMQISLSMVISSSTVVACLLSANTTMCLFAPGRGAAPIPNE